MLSWVCGLIFTSHSFFTYWFYNTDTLKRKDASNWHLGTWLQVTSLRVEFEKNTRSKNCYWIFSLTVFIKCVRTVAQTVWKRANYLISRLLFRGQRWQVCFLPLRGAFCAACVVLSCRWSVESVPCADGSAGFGLWSCMMTSPDSRAAQDGFL